MGVGQADDLGQRWHGRPLQVAGSVVAWPTTASPAQDAQGSARRVWLDGRGRHGSRGRGRRWRAARWGEVGGGGQGEAKARMAVEGGGGPLAVVW